MRLLDVLPHFYRCSGQKRAQNSISETPLMVLIIITTTLLSSPPLPRLTTTAHTSPLSVLYCLLQPQLSFYPSIARLYYILLSLYSLYLSTLYPFHNFLSTCICILHLYTHQQTTGAKMGVNGVTSGVTGVASGVAFVGNTGLNGVKFVAKAPVSIFTAATSGATAASAAVFTPPADKYVLVPIANGSEEIESVTIIDTLVRAGAKVTVACVSSDENGKQQSTLEVRESRWNVEGA
jgi:hypothetical protein